MDSDLLIFLEITVGVIIFLSVSLYLITKWAEIEMNQMIIEKDELQKDETKSINKITTDLHYLKNISREELILLSQEKISKIEDLKNKLNTDGDIHEFSEKLGIRRKLVEEWVTLGDFSSLHGMTKDYIQLLKKVGIMSVKDLRNQKPESLWEMLSENPDITVLPSLEMIRYWVRKSDKIIQE